MKNKQVVLKENQIAIINPFEIHSAIKIDSNSTNLYSIYFDLDWIIKLQKDIFGVNYYIEFDNNIIFDEKIYLEFLNLCKMIFSDTFCIQKEENIIKFLSNIIIKNHKKPILIVTKNNLVYDIKNYIDNNINENLTLELLSKEFLLTSFHIIRIFKQEFKLSPYQYILNAKINLCKKLLSQNISISEVALQCGFNDQSHLYKYFKQVFSITPRQYQKSLKK